MAKWPKSTAIVVAADTLITSHPAWLHSLIITDSVAGAGATVYEGQDATSGRQIAHFHGPNNDSFQAVFDPPLWCERGIYVDLEANVDHLVIHYTPQSLNRPEGD